MHRTDRHLLLCWLALLGLTLLSFESAWGLAWLRDPSAAIAFVVIVALLKVRIVLMNFMEIRGAPWALRGPLELWLIALGVGLLTLWYRAGA